MREIGTQLREYLDATAPEVSMTEIAILLDSPESVQPARPENGGGTSDERERRPGGRFGGKRGWIALAAAVAAILLIGVAAQFFAADDVVVEPDQTTATSNSAEDGPPAIPEESPRAIPADAIEPPAPGLSRATGGTPLPGIENAVLADDGAPPLPPGAVNSLPNEDRLDFLFECVDSPFTPPDAGPPPYGEPDMARLTPAEMEEMFGPFEEMGPDLGDAGEAPPPPGPEVEIDASGAAATGGPRCPTSRRRSRATMGESACRRVRSPS